MSYGVLYLLKLLEVQKVLDFIYEHNTYAQFLNASMDVNQLECCGNSSSNLENKMVV
jgi:hypothetical protein